MAQKKRTRKHEQALNAPRNAVQFAAPDRASDSGKLLAWSRSQAVFDLAWSSRSTFWRARASFKLRSMASRSARNDG